MLLTIRLKLTSCFDEGAQSSFISAEKANGLQISPTSTLDIAIVSFETMAATSQKLGVATVEVETESSENFTASISAPIQNLVLTAVYTMPHIQDLKLVIRI